MTTTIDATITGPHIAGTGQVVQGGKVVLLFSISGTEDAALQPAQAIHP